MQEVTQADVFVASLDVSLREMRIQLVEYEDEISFHKGCEAWGEVKMFERRAEYLRVQIANLEVVRCGVHQ